MSVLTIDSNRLTPLVGKITLFCFMVPFLLGATDLEKWLKDLGNSDYAIRNQAEQKILQTGLEALPILKSAKNTDPHIRISVKRLVDKIERRALTDSVAEFLSPRSKKSLPGWRSFSRQTKNEKLARNYFGNMYLRFPDVFNHLNSPLPKFVDEYIYTTEDFIQKRYASPRVAEPAGIAMFAGAKILARLAQREKLPIQQKAKFFQRLAAVNLALVDSKVNLLLEQSQYAPLFRSLLSQWVMQLKRLTSKERTTYRLTPNLYEILGRFRMTEHCEFLFEVVNDKTNSRIDRSIALLAIGSAATTSKLVQLERLLESKEVVLTFPVYPVYSNINQAETQPPSFCTQTIGDLALVSCLRCVGAPLNDFPFQSRSASNPLGRDYGFKNQLDRSRAIQKWIDEKPKLLNKAAQRESASSMEQPK